MQGWNLYAQITHVDCYVELVCKSLAEDGIVRVVYVYHVEGDILCPCVLLVAKGHWE
jgi:hypothetical protein